MSILTNIDNKNHIFIQIISDYYKNMNLYILVLLSYVIWNAMQFGTYH